MSDDNNQQQGSNEAIQLIDEKKHFAKDTIAYFSKCLSSTNGKDDETTSDYHVISVFGSQSSGKSTLLNILFNTSFDTMDAQIKRQQTTKGIWLSHTHTINTTNSSQTPTLSDMFILDVEGSDGSERGEDQDFERKAALFAIAVSEVLLVNMWEQQIGLYQGNNMALLKTVFEVNLSLFGKTVKSKSDHKVLLLFVIRDHVRVTPMDSLKETLVNELEKIWTELSKPDECKDTTLYDFFDLEFIGLGHKLLQYDQFVKDVKQLGDSFNKLPVEDGSLFKENYHHPLPLEGWSMYAENCWEQIENNKDLDLPTQQILVARFKTDEILNECFVKLITEYNLEINSMVKDMDLLTSFLQKIKNLAVQEYDQHASRYNQVVYQEKRTELLNKIDSKFLETINTFLEDLSTDLLLTFESNVNAKDPSSPSFIEKLNSNKTIIIGKFSSVLLNFQNLDLLSETDGISDIFRERVMESYDKLREKELNSIISKSNKTISNKIKEMTIFNLSHPSLKVWDIILANFESINESTLKKYRVKKDVNNDDDMDYDFRLGLSEEDNRLAYKRIRSHAWYSLSTTVRDYLKEDTVVSILRDRFENKFRYDHNDAPRLWTNEDEIDQAFALAKEHALEVFTVLSLAKTSYNIEIIPDVSSPLGNESDDDDDNDDEEKEYEDELGIYHTNRFAHIFNELQKEKILSQFRRQINLTVLDAKRSIITTTTHIPIWIYCLLVVLGWNEFMIVIKNPLFVTLIIISVVTFYFIHKFDLWGPVITIINTAIGETKGTLKSKLRKFVIDDDEHGKKRQTTKKVSKEKDSESYEMEDM
ncbi:dynamin-like GTPase SEY1 NDAI_0K02810 [Naumovozyma dairenensis CBS 421]|uniref:GB1/RHD3-type G domain-containing protein n=1 Tax=Naumovozyma dairenensis (strain ATCC 10597 / BCRC 20456 / CBS 421 / NBRC 0211 / NRRL Y-12639) TaxID=1071378 RepID=G0WI61_NAUDC|nr:hypothetical protein NDAI_0K02810 [Naumovozyma dairenensis CBS 421]CCD27472.1 hypothetical protein NDAI_0K02810 [Naumovozyma dairenensis CBS 421]